MLAVKIQRFQIFHCFLYAGTPETIGYLVCPRIDGLFSARV